jgi:hypothetical protein
MKISEKLPQFADVPTLFVVAGDYEALFYKAFQGEVELTHTIKHIPREEILGKDDGFLTRSASMPGVGAVSAKGTRELSIRKKFYHEVAKFIEEAARYGNVGVIHFFAPHQVTKQVNQLLDAPTKKILKEELEGNFTKESPTDIIRRMKKLPQ